MAYHWQFEMPLKKIEAIRNVSHVEQQCNTLFVPTQFSFQMFVVHVCRSIFTHHVSPMLVQRLMYFCLGFFPGFFFFIQKQSTE